MNSGWTPDDEPNLPKLDVVGALRFILRLIPMALITFGGLALLLVIRLVELPLFGAHRPITPWITQSVCWVNMWILGIHVDAQGTPLKDRGAMVANHVSWLDVYGLNSRARLYFVAKQEVAGWAGIGWLARATGTVFVERRVAAAKTQKDVFLDRLSKGHRLLFFPEGTSTDGKQVLDFKPTLFAAFFEDALRERYSIQPISQIYSAPPGRDSRFFGWWGSMDFGPHFLSVMAAPRGGSIQIIFHEPVRVAEFPNRKLLAAHLHSIVSEGHSTGQRIAAA